MSSTSPIRPDDLPARTIFDPMMWSGSGTGRLRTLGEAWLLDWMIQWGVRALTPPELRRDMPFVGITLRDRLSVVFAPETMSKEFWAQLGYRLRINETPDSDRLYVRRSMANDAQQQSVPHGEVHIKLPYIKRVYDLLGAMMPRAATELYLLDKKHPAFPGPQHKDTDCLRRLLTLRLLLEDVALRLSSIPANFGLLDKVLKHQALTQELLVKHRESLWNQFAIDAVSFEFLPPGLWPLMTAAGEQKAVTGADKPATLSNDEVPLEPANRAVAEEALIARYRNDFGCQRAVRPAEGVFRRRNYIAFLLWSKSDRLYAVLDSVTADNALYIFVVGDTLNDHWKPAARRTKSELLAAGASNTLFIERMNHTGSVYSRLADFLAEH